MALDNLAFLLPGQRVENRTQLPACLPEDGLPTPLGHENYVVLSTPSRNVLTGYVLDSGRPYSLRFCFLGYATGLLNDFVVRRGRDS